MPFRDLPGVTKCRFEPGDCLIAAGERVDYIYYLQKGVVYRELLTDKGHESILSRKVGDSAVSSLIGILPWYRRSDVGVSTNDFVAKTNCVCYRIPKDVCIAYLQQHHELLEEVIRIVLEDYMRLMDLFQAKRAGDVSSRLCRFLLLSSSETKQGKILPKKYTNVEIAKFLSVHKVTVARILRALKDENCVTRVEGGLLLCNETELEAYASQQKLLEYK